MPYNGSGTFTSLTPPQYPAVAGDVIRAAYFNSVINDLIAGLSTALCRDGQSTVSADLPMNGKKFTDVADGSADTHFASYKQLRQAVQIQTFSSFTAGGTAPAYTLSSTNYGALTTKERLHVKFTVNGTTGSNTLNRDGLGAKALKQIDSSGVLVDAVIFAGLSADVEYDGTYYVVLNPVQSVHQLSSCSATVAANALTATLSARSIDFRSTTSADGAITTLGMSSSVTLTVPSGATLGTTSGVAARLVLLAINNAGTVELAIANPVGLSLDEADLISTTALSAAADSAGVAYSTTARANVPYRVVGYIDINEATAGTWASAPTLVQAAGGAYTPQQSRMIMTAAVATTSGTAIDLVSAGSIPPWAKKITINLDGVSTNGTSAVLVQIGAGSYATSGYNSSGTGFGPGNTATINFTTGFALEEGSTPTYARYGAFVLAKTPGETWCITGSQHRGSQLPSMASGSKTLSGLLDRIRLTTVSGTDVFDAGSCSLLIEG